MNLRILITPKILIDKLYKALIIYVLTEAN